MIYLYAITQHSDHPLPGLQGLDGHEIERIQLGGLDAIVSTCMLVDKSPSVTILWKHEGVIEALMRDRCVLPVRYGTCLSSREELTEVMKAGQVSFMEDLDRLSGCVEISLRVIDPSETVRYERKRPQAVSQEVTGKNYLLDRLQQMNSIEKEQKKLRAWAAKVHERLLGISVEGKLQVHSQSILRVSGVYLLERVHLHAFQVLVGQIRSVYKEYKFMCTGPWPPYNFVSPMPYTLTVN